MFCSILDSLFLAWIELCLADCSFENLVKKTFRWVYFSIIRWLRCSWGTHPFLEHEIVSKLASVFSNCTFTILNFSGFIAIEFIFFILVLFASLALISDVYLKHIGGFVWGWIFSVYFAIDDVTMSAYSIWFTLLLLMMELKFSTFSSCYLLSL